jgi:hypothetical protein
MHSSAMFDTTRVETLGSSPEKEGQGRSGGTSRSFWRVSGMSWREGRGEAWVATEFEVALNCLPLFLAHPNNQNGCPLRVLLEVSLSTPQIWIIQQEDTRLRYRISMFISALTMFCVFLSQHGRNGAPSRPPRSTTRLGKTSGIRLLIPSNFRNPVGRSTSVVVLPQR